MARLSRISHTSSRPRRLILTQRSEGKHEVWRPRGFEKLGRPGNDRNRSAGSGGPHKQFLELLQLCYITYLPKNNNNRRNFCSDECEKLKKKKPRNK